MMKIPSLPVEKYEAIFRELEGHSDLGEDVKRHLEERDRYLRMLNEVLSSLPEGSHALELGCGTAIDSCILSKRYPQIHFSGLDITRGSLVVSRRVGEQMGERIFLLQGDVFRLPFRTDSIQLIFHQGLVEHFREPDGMMKEQARVLVPGGWSVISVPQTFTGYTVMKKGRIREETWPWGWETSYTAGELIALGKSVGLEPAETRGEGYWRSWGEPTWVLRDLYGKLDRRNPMAGKSPFRMFRHFWDGLWNCMEEIMGHYFCKNVIVSFQKKSSGEESVSAAENALTQPRFGGVSDD
ncbi:MAG: class I SAM-dependent methyltransferase [Nitrospinaceae bacterium]|nr:class I SAM-dependent methyltransferase [Nitrospinaceae bacterium]